MRDQSPIRRSDARRPAGPTLRLRLGRWFQADATGWAVALVPLILVLLITAAVVAR